MSTLPRRLQKHTCPVLRGAGRCPLQPWAHRRLLHARPMPPMFAQPPRPLQPRASVRLPATVARTGGAGHARVQGLAWAGQGTGARLATSSASKDADGLINKEFAPVRGLCCPLGRHRSPTSLYLSLYLPALRDPVYLMTHALACTLAWADGGARIGGGCRVSVVLQIHHTWDGGRGGLAHTTAGLRGQRT
jgi:hypothetical protein